MTEQTPEPIARFGTPLDPQAAVDALRAMSKRGKLAGFDAADAGSGDRRTVRAAAHGTPFDADLILELERTDDGSRVEARTRLRRLMPGVFIAVLVLTVWPGLPLAEAFLLSFTWYERLVGGVLETWMWYIPITVLPAPWAVLKSIRRSKDTARRHALETIGRIERTLGAP